MLNGGGSCLKKIVKISQNISMVADLEEKMKQYALQSGIELEKLREFYKDGDKASRLKGRLLGC